jgi:hypothetical protein
MVLDRLPIDQSPVITMLLKLLSHYQGDDVLSTHILACLTNWLYKRGIYDIKYLRAISLIINEIYMILNIYSLNKLYY